MDAPYYFQAVIGLVSIGLTVRIVHKVVSPAAAWIAAAFFVLYDFPLTYAKILYYTTLHYFFIALALLVFLEAIKRGKRWLYLLAGALSGMLVIVNASGIILAGLLIPMLLIGHANGAWGRPKISSLGALLLLGAGAALTYIAFEAYLLAWFAIHSELRPMTYFASIYEYGTGTRAYYHLGPSYVFREASYIGGFAFSLQEGGWFRSGVLVIGVAAGAILSLMRRDRPARMFAGFLIFGLAAMALLAALGIQPFFPRILLWSALPVTVLVSYAIETSWRAGARPFRWILAGVLMVYAFFGVEKCLAVTQATFSVDPIIQYLDQRGIDRRRVITGFPINRYKDFKSGVVTGSLPILVGSKAAPVNAKGVVRLYNWPAIQAAYQKGLVRYLITSDIDGVFYHSGESEPLLDQMTPVAEWDHPNANRHLYPGLVPLKIKLYDLESVLESPAAARWIEYMSRQLK